MSRRPPARLIWTALWLGLALFLVLRTTGRERGVILDHVEFGRRLLHGEDPYAPYAAEADEALHPLHPPYPPSFGLLAAPFSLIARLDAATGPDGTPDLRTSRLSRLAWALLQVLSIWAIARCLRAWLITSDFLRQQLGRLHGALFPRATASLADEHADATIFQCLFLGALVLCSRFVLRDTHGGGGNLINIALCLLAFHAAERHQPVRSGLWLGLSLATKPALLWLLPVLWLFGHRRAALCTIGWGLAAALLSWLMLRCDAGPWLRWLEGTFRFSTQADAFAVPALAFPEFTWMNQSLRCALARFLGEVPAPYASEVNGFFPGLGLSAATVAWVARACSLALLAALFVAANRARTDASARHRVVAAALIVSLLLSPLSWKAHHVALLPAFFLLLQHALAARARWVFVLVLVFIPTCALGEEVLGKELKNTMQSLYWVTAWDLALLLALTRVRARI